MSERGEMEEEMKTELTDAFNTISKILNKSQELPRSVIHTLLMWNKRYVKEYIVFKKQVIDELSIDEEDDLHKVILSFTYLHEDENTPPRR